MSADDFTIGPGARTCTSCRALGRCRLGVGQAHAGAGGLLVVDAQCPGDWQGGPGVAHGGWISAAFGEALSLVVLLQHDPRIVTQRVTVHYRRPVPVLRPLVLTGRLRARQGRTWLVTGELALGPDGPVLAAAEAAFVSRREGHYRRHQAWMQAQDA